MPLSLNEIRARAFAREWDGETSERAEAHAALDRAVDAAYLAAEKAAGRKAPKLGTDAERVAFLFERYQ